MKEFLEQSLMYLFAGFAIAGVIGVGIIVICMAIMLLKQDKD